MKSETTGRKTEATYVTVREAIAAARSGQSWALEESVAMPVERSKEFARTLLLDEPDANVLTYVSGPWLHVVPTS